MKHLIKLLLLTLPLTLLGGEATVEQLFSVKSVTVKEQKTYHIRKNFGFVRADEARVYHLSPRFGGYVEKIYADKIYTYVTKGAPLAEVYSPEVYKAKEDYLNSYNYTKKSTNRGMLKSAKLKLQLLGIGTKEIDAILQTKSISQTTTIYAPQSGYIFQKNISQGSAFKAKERLFEIVNLDEVWVEAKVFEEDISWLKGVNQFELHFKSTPRIYRANSKLLYPMIDEKEATMTLRLRVKNPKKELFVGMYTTIISKEKPKTYLTLPSDALLKKDQKFYVFVVGEYEGEYEPLEVDVKPLNAKTYIITEGLSVGDVVVRDALFMMDSDAQINGLY